MVLRDFLRVGREDVDSGEDVQLSMQRKDLLMPHSTTTAHLMPKASGVFAHLGLFTGVQADSVGEEDMEGGVEDVESRQRIVRNVFEKGLRKGLEGRLKEGGEIGRAAGAVVKLLDGMLSGEDTQ